MTRQADTITYIELHNDLSGRLALDDINRVLVWLASDAETVRTQVYGTAIFTESEWAVVVPVLKHHPHYCPLEMMLASFGGAATEQSVARARQQYYAALDAGETDRFLKPMRTVLSRARGKLQTIGLDTLCMYQTGYVLMKSKKEAR